jgi:hypothetical protein
MTGVSTAEDTLSHRCGYTRYELDASYDECGVNSFVHPLTHSGRRLGSFVFGWIQCRRTVVPRRTTSTPLGVTAC